MLSKLLYNSDISEHKKKVHLEIQILSLFDELSFIVTSKVANVSLLYCNRRYLKKNTMISFEFVDFWSQISETPRPK